MAVGMSITDSQFLMLPCWSHLGAVRPPPGLEHMETASLQLQLLKALEVSAHQPQKVTEKCGFWSEEFGLHP
eukprot:CAMPEP_0181477930 /NCGR_PEP_ID=MMETSP1110-20121109/42474_1 /TAXON_ID=174948 /ORGANISM="Symbiodinium sp., Strain CCMP421" /LENGTH=71 /DNA_ID=CAMNT_0023603255 /DNA_START=84 /DNA_END=296 /DNA_ORIENTATION=+